MKTKVVHIILLFLFMGSSGLAQRIKNPDISFVNARSMAFEGNRSMARDSLQRILFAYPNYADAELLIAKTYSWDGEYDEARKRLNRITSVDKLKREVWVASIKNEIYAKNLNIALGLANKALVHLQHDTEIEGLREKILVEINKKPPIDEKLKEENSTKQKMNTISVSSSLEVFDVVFDPMYQASIEYQRTTKIGKLIPRINYAQRFTMEGAQFEMDAYPTLSKTFHAYVNYGYSDAIIFPRHRAGLELYAELPKAFEASLGGRHLSFNEVNATILTGSFGVYRGNYYISARPFVSIRNDAQMGLAGNVLVRKYGKDGDNYLGVRLNYGFDTELNQFIVDRELLSQTQLYLESQRLDFEYQFTSGHENKNLYTVNAGVRRQELAFDTGNYFWAISAGLKYQFRF